MIDCGAVGVDRERLERHDRHHEDDRQAGQQDVERDLVRRLLALGALDERDHAVEERLAGLRRDLHDDLVGEHPRAARDRAAVATRLADHRRRLAGDRRLVDRRDALDHVAVAGNELAGPDDAEVADLQLARRDLGDACRRPAARTRPSRRASCAASRPAPCPGPSAIASAKFANSTVNHRNAATRPENQSVAAPTRLMSRKNRNVVRTLPDLDDEHHRVLGLQARVELHEAVDERAPHDRRLEHRAAAPLRVVRIELGRHAARASSGLRERLTTDTSPTP